MEEIRPNLYCDVLYTMRLCEWLCHVPVTTVARSGVPRAGVWEVQTSPEIPKALQNRAKLNPIVKTV